jgi:methylmalonyl-CoA mutase
MSKLGNVVDAVEKYNQFVLDEVKRARTDKKFGAEMTRRWEEIQKNIPSGRAPTGLKLPRLALPEIDEPGEIARYLLGEGLPGEFPYTAGAYREMYLEPLRELEAGSYEKTARTGARKAAGMERAARPRPSQWRSRNRRGSFPASAWQRTRTNVFIFSPVTSAVPG